MEHIVEKKRKINRQWTLTQLMREVFKGILDPIASQLNKWGLTPNIVTIIGLVGNLIGAYFIARGGMLIGGIIVLAMGPVDALDGTMARLRGEPKSFGAFVDSVTDRYIELAIYAGLMVYFINTHSDLGVLLVYSAAAGSVLVSYVKARAESLGLDANTGLLTRAERYLILAPTLIFNQLIAGLFVIAIFANITALQRIIRVRKNTRNR